MKVLKLALATNLFWFVGSVFATGVSQDVGWNLNDVSVLFALPESQSQLDDFLLRPTSQGVKGELLPWSDFERVPTLLNHRNGNLTQYKSALRVVSMRFDPCPEIPVCRPELRLVWQSVEWDSGLKRWTTYDGTVHTFYSLSSSEYEQVKSELWALKMRAKAEGVDTSRQPLGVHPAMLSMGSRKWFTQRLMKLVLDTCGQQNLRKMTFMSLLVPSTWWRFGGFERDAGGAWKSVTIPRLTNGIEDIFNSAMENGSVDIPGREMDAVFNTLPDNYPVEDDLMPLINKGYRNNDDTDLNTFQEKLDAVARFRNPHRTNPGNLDCASCHFADAAASFASFRFPALASFQSLDGYINPEPTAFDLSNRTVSQQATRVVRAFGYFKEEPAIMQRVIHDSAESAHYLNRSR